MAFITSHRHGKLALGMEYIRSTCNTSANKVLSRHTIIITCIYLRTTSCNNSFDAFSYYYLCTTRMIFGKRQIYKRKKVYVRHNSKWVSILHLSVHLNLIKLHRLQIKGSVGFCRSSWKPF